MIEQLRYKLSVYFFQLGIWILPDEWTKMYVRSELTVASQAMLDDLEEADESV